MIAESAQDLVAKVKSIASNKFGTTTKRVGLAIGGKSIDPLIEKSPRPLAWIIFTSDENLDTDDQGVCGSYIKLNFVVKLLIDYTNETDLLTNQLPLLEEVINAVGGQQGPIGSKRWKYEGQSMDELTATRLVFDQRYSIITIL